MRSKIFTLIVFSFLTLSLKAQSTLTFHDYSAVTITGDTINMSQYWGKKLLIVNTASFCAYTPQFADLENLYNQYHQYNFEIIGFPCNDFGSQDPHDDSTINQFCTGTYGVTFQMMSKIAIIAGDTSPIYKWLQRADLNGVSDAHVAWNFNKFCIDEAGHWVAHYLSPVLPTDTAITNWIMSPSVIASTKIVSPVENVIQLTSPNPTNSTIDFNVANMNGSKISINLFSAEGKLIATIYSGSDRNLQHISYNACDLSAGLYFINANVDGVNKSFKVAITE